MDALLPIWISTYNEENIWHFWIIDYGNRQFFGLLLLLSNEIDWLLLLLFGFWILYGSFELILQKKENDALVPL